MVAKVFKEIKFLCLLLAAIFTTIGIFIDETLFVALTFVGIVFSLIALFVGLVLTFAESKQTRGIGYALLTASVVAVFGVELFNLVEGGRLQIGDVFAILGLVFVLIAYVCLGLLKLFNAEESAAENLDKRVEILKSYKEMVAEGFLTQEEFEAKRVELLKVKPAKKDKAGK